MKLSKNLVGVLRNFSTINRSLKILPGNEIVVAAAGGGVFGRYFTDVTFPVEVCIYDVPELLSTISIFDDPEIEFLEDRLVLSGNGSEVVYSYTDPATVRIPTMKFDAIRKKYPVVAENIRISEEKFGQAIKAAAIMRLALATIEGDGEQVVISLVPEKKTTANTMKSVIGRTEDVFSVTLEVEKLKMIPGDYDLTIFEQFVIFDRVLGGDAESDLSYAVVQPSSAD